MRKITGQNHPHCEERGLWEQFTYFSSKKGLWRSFSNRREDRNLRWAEPVYVFQISGFPTARGSRKAPATAAGFIWSALSAEENLTIYTNRSGVLLNARKLNNRLINYGDGDKRVSSKFTKSMVLGVY